MLAVTPSHHGAHGHSPLCRHRPARPPWRDEEAEPFVSRVFTWGGLGIALLVAAGYGLLLWWHAAGRILGDPWVLALVGHLGLFGCLAAGAHVVCGLGAVLALAVHGRLDCCPALSMVTSAVSGLFALGLWRLACALGGVIEFGRTLAAMFQ
jgi:hypothetical protein